MNPVTLGTMLLITIFLITTGMLCQFIVVSENGGKMPVYHGGETDRHFGYDDPNDVNYFWLSDIFPFQNYAFSLGDAILVCGLCLLFVCAFYHCVNLHDKGKAKKKKREKGGTK